jgi:hypothetical protein
MRADTLLTRNEQMGCLEPLVKWYFGALKNCPDRYGKLTVARAATIYAPAYALPLDGSNAFQTPTAGAKGSTGQSIASSLALAASSLWKCGSERMLTT